ncbi:unnamed protein product [Anisakis simplex]|uniref:Ovule protein n=1 Tax=Anisakis simplex TaxID=6269 RepID=A0A0M3JTT5_ANISI|nr:unnamed protein product [Anisakis simplex]
MTQAQKNASSEEHANVQSKPDAELSGDSVGVSIAYQPSSVQNIIAMKSSTHSNRSSKSSPSNHAKCNSNAEEKEVSFFKCMPLLFAYA